MKGFIGLGNMGCAFAKRLIQSGADLLVYDVNHAAVAQLEEAGATACSSVQELADRASMVLTCLPNPEVSLQVAREVARGSTVEILAELSTIGRSAIVEMNNSLGASGIQLVDAPVSGGPLGASQGSLSLMLSGAEEAVDRVARVCRPACGKETYIGPEPGQSQLAKLVNNGISMTAFLVSCEVVGAIVGAGIPASKVLDYVNQGRGRNSGSVTKIPKNILHRTFDLGPPLISALKDQDLFLEEYRKTDLPAGVVSGTRELWEKTTRLLDPDGDAATIIQYFEHFTGKEVAATSGAHSDRTGDEKLLKLADDVIAFTVLAATCEATAVGLVGGIAPHTQLALLNAGTACSYWSESVFEAQIMFRRFDSGTTIGEVCERLRNYLELAEKTGLPPGLVNRALQVWEETAAELGAEKDATALMTRYESVAGVTFG